MSDLPPDLRSAIAERFPDLAPAEPDADDAEADPGGLLVPVDQHVAFARFLKQQLGFTLYVTVVGSHWPAKGDDQVEHYEVATVLRRPVKPAVAIRWRVRVPCDQPVPTLYPLFAGADWQEREQYDLVGVVFEGHPDPRRLMLPEDWEGHPLRKEYAIDTPHPPWR